MTEMYKIKVFSQKRVDIEMIQRIISNHKYLGTLSNALSHQIIIVTDTDLKSLMSLYVKRSELLNSSPCILACLAPRYIKSEAEYFINRNFFFMRIIQRFLDFVVHSVRPLPRRLYSSLEEENYSGLDMRIALGGILDKLKSTGLVYKFMPDIDRERLSKILKVPHTYRLTSLVCVGSPMEEEEEVSSVGIHLNTYEGEG